MGDSLKILPLCSIIAVRVSCHAIMRVLYRLGAQVCNRSIESKVLTLHQEVPIQLPRCNELLCNWEEFLEQYQVTSLVTQINFLQNMSFQKEINCDFDSICENWSVWEYVVNLFVEKSKFQSWCKIFVTNYSVEMFNFKVRKFQRHNITKINGQLFMQTIEES